MEAAPEILQTAAVLDGNQQEPDAETAELIIDTATDAIGKMNIDAGVKAHALPDKQILEARAVQAIADLRYKPAKAIVNGEGHIVEGRILITTSHAAPAEEADMTAATIATETIQIAAAQVIK